MTCYDSGADDAPDFFNGKLLEKSGGCTMTEFLGVGRLERVMRAAKKGSRRKLPDLTVLAAQNDPYRQHTDAGIRDAMWFAEQMEKHLRPFETIHLRGLFYRIVAKGDVRMPDGDLFVNTEELWSWFANRAAKTARWLGYVPFDRIVDERNAAPEIFLPGAKTAGWHLSVGDAAFVPDLCDAMPRFECSEFTARQRYRLVFIGEKTSLGAVLRPLTQSVGGELLLPSGEISDTQVYGLANRAMQDGRPTVVFYFSDFDPAGHQMPISVGRKLQALRDLQFPDLDVQLYHVGLTLDHVKQFKLPSTPLKDTERRADHWRERMGHEQTEIDAMIALYPDELRQIARDAVAPFYDDTLRNRTADAERDWRHKAEQFLLGHPDYSAVRSEVAGRLESARQAVEFFEAAQERARDLLGVIEPPPLRLPAIDLGEASPSPLFTTADEYLAATARLKAYRELDDDSDE